MTRRTGRGFLYVDVLVALLVLATCLPAALSALTSATRAAAEERAVGARRYRVNGMLEQLLATPHAALDAAAVAAGGPTVPTSYSDPAGTPERRLVFIARYDVDNADADGNGLTGGDAGLLWLRVKLDGRSSYAVETLTAQ